MHYSSEIDSAYSKNEYQVSSWCKARPVSKADNLIANFKLIVQKMLYPLQHYRHPWPVARIALVY
jgi:hypothetical protein